MNLDIGKLLRTPVWYPASFFKRTPVSGHRFPTAESVHHVAVLSGMLTPPAEVRTDLEKQLAIADIVAEVDTRDISPLVRLSYEVPVDLATRLEPSPVEQWDPMTLPAHKSGRFYVVNRPGQREAAKAAAAEKAAN